ncbi:DNA binding domain-containing protein (modular protein) [uncultured Eubacteriales bacterium]|uniref:DNA binding domain-containing protein (Modular protein) n=1 Tax=uncultured Eubacteriales bacterium TaxID=172733 RepID=A0A212JI53_9FIRM|nr:DNA binding domain-containing protein (modular protein) [uncultured Eubacteriales bacterium]
MMEFINDYGYRYGYDDDERLAPYLRAEEVMSLLCIGKNTFYRLVNSGELKGFRIGKQWRIARESIKNFADEKATRR